MFLPKKVLIKRVVNNLNLILKLPVSTFFLVDARINIF